MLELVTLPNQLVINRYNSNDENRWQSSFYLHITRIQGQAFYTMSWVESNSIPFVNRRVLLDRKQEFWTLVRAMLKHGMAESSFFVKDYCRDSILYHKDTLMRHYRNLDYKDIAETLGLQ